MHVGGVGGGIEERRRDICRVYICTSVFIEYIFILYIYVYVCAYNVLRTFFFFFLFHFLKEVDFHKVTRWAGGQFRIQTQVVLASESSLLAPFVLQFHNPTALQVL